jgi:hypothetical protein
MEKNVGIPNSVSYDASLSLVNKLSNFLSFKYWSFRCKNMNYEEVLSRSHSVVDEILDFHKLKNHFYDNSHFEIIIETTSGWSFEISKINSVSEENIILYLFEDKSFARASYTIVFLNKKGNIVGINNMFHGWSTDSFFHDLESPLLNPNVLAALLSSKEKLKTGTVRKLIIKDKYMQK